MSRSMDEICAMEAGAIADLVRRRELSPVEVTKAHLERMDRLDPLLHAFCTPTPDLALAPANDA